MPQLPITPAISQQLSAGGGQASASVVSATEVGGGLEDSPGLNFGALLTKQLKGVAALLGQKEDGGLALAAGEELAEPAANAGGALFPLDLSFLTASLLVPAPAAQAVIPGGIPAETETRQPLIQLFKMDGARSAAEIAAGGKSLPTAVSPEQPFADRLAVSVGIPASNAGVAFPASNAGVAFPASNAGVAFPASNAGVVFPASNAGVEFPASNAGVEFPASNAGVEFPASNAGNDLFAAAGPLATVAISRNAETLPALPVAPKVGSPEWGGAVGDKIVWMVNRSHQVAELHLNPPNLGPLEVRLTINNDQASALFVSPHSAVREAIETALPRLREMLADNGIMLGNATVGSESFGQKQANEQGNGKEGSRGGLAAEGGMARMAVSGQSSGRGHDGMVDIFA